MATVPIQPLNNYISFLLLQFVQTNKHKKKAATTTFQIMHIIRIYHILMAPKKKKPYK